MELTLLLAKVFGLYMLFGGILVLMRPRYIMLAVAALIEDKSLRLVFGIIGILLGLLLVNTHNTWNTLPEILVSLIGWAALVKSVMYLFLKESTMDKIVKMFMDRKWYVIDGIVAILFGAYLANYGYGLL